VAKPSWASFFAEYRHPVLEQIFESSHGIAEQIGGSRFAKLFAMAAPPAASESPLTPPVGAESVAGPSPKALPDGALTHEFTVSLGLSSPDGVGTAGDYLVSVLASSEINFVLDVGNQKLVAPNEWPFLIEQMAGILGPSAETLTNAGAPPSAELAAILAPPDLPLDLTPVTIPGH
jgi:hypothetical protein